MVPPKLNMVSRETRDEPEHDFDEPAAEPAAAPERAESGRGLPSNIAQLPSADRRETLRMLERLARFDTQG